MTVRQRGEGRRLTGSRRQGIRRTAAERVAPTGVDLLRQIVLVISEFTDDAGHRLLFVTVRKKKQITVDN